MNHCLAGFGGSLTTQWMLDILPSARAHQPGAFICVSRLWRSSVWRFHVRFVSFVSPLNSSVVSFVFPLKCLSIAVSPPSAYMSLHLEDFTLEELLAAACRVEERGGAGGAA